MNGRVSAASNFGLHSVVDHWEGDVVGGELPIFLLRNHL